MTVALDALRAESDRFGATLAALSPDDWQRPTRCPPMDLRRLTAHALRGAERIIEFLGRPPTDPPADVDAVSYFRYDPAVVGPDVVRRAAEAAGSRTGAEIAALWATTWPDALALGQEPDPSPEGVAVVCGVLAGLLSAEPPPGLDGVRFILTGTGRAPLDAKERKALGPLVARFPLLA
jgi:mycothiol maleylpyruvate isomerase-like protein